MLLWCKSLSLFLSKPAGFVINRKLTFLTLQSVPCSVMCAWGDSTAWGRLRLYRGLSPAPRKAWEDFICHYCELSLLWHFGKTEYRRKSWLNFYHLIQNNDIIGWVSLPIILFCRPPPPFTQNCNLQLLFSSLQGLHQKTREWVFCIRRQSIGSLVFISRMSINQ